MLQRMQSRFHDVNSGYDGCMSSLPCVHASLVVASSPLFVLALLLNGIISPTRCIFMTFHMLVVGDARRRDPLFPVGSVDDLDLIRDMCRSTTVRGDQRSHCSRGS